MPTQTITLTPPDPMSLDNILDTIALYVPSEVDNFISKCRVEGTLTIDVSKNNNTVTIVRSWSPSVVALYKEVSALDVLSEELTALNWVVTVDPATADL